MKSILQKNTDKCFICGSRQWLEWHHVFGAATRTKSERLGLVVRLCHYCHNEPPNGVHQNKDIRSRLQSYAQKKAMQVYNWTVDDFRREFYKNYIKEDIE
jgi:hypothetical protein